MDEQTLVGIKGIVNIVSSAVELLVEKIANFTEWYRANQDKIQEYIEGIEKLAYWQNAVDKLTESQIVFTEPMSGEIIDRINKAKSVENFILEYYSENGSERLEKLIGRCGSAKEVLAYKKLYPQVVVASEMGCYQLACLGLFTLEDGILADVTNEPKNTNFNNRIKKLENKINDKIPLSDIDLQILEIIVTFDKFKETAFGNSNFNEAEPNYLNRHWTLHGRSRREYTKLDFIRMLLSLDALIFMMNLTEQPESEDSEDKEDEL